MADKDWDDRERWEDDSKCLVCKVDMGKSEALVCSATCEDIWSLRHPFRGADIHDDWENDCYA